MDDGGASAPDGRSTLRSVASTRAPDLTPFVSELAVGWTAEQHAARMRSVPGTLVFADVSGFTRLTEKLARAGRVGAEEISDHLDLVLSALLESAYDFGGRLVKWGGDALLLLYAGPRHAERACAASAAMRSTMATVGRLDTSAGRVRLRKSVGVHTGSFDLTLVGAVHRELLITGADASTTATLEATAEAGEILLSRQTAEQLPASCRGREKGTGVLLARAPKLNPLGASDVVATDTAGLLPDLVLGHLRAGGGSGEHRPVAIGFLEFSGMGALHRSHGRDRVVDALEHVVDVTQLACQRHQVSFHETDISPDGGKIMLVAGAPNGLDDPAEAMLCTLREVFDDPGELTLRAGVTSGRAFTGCLGPWFRRSYSVKGDVVNLAARVMGKTVPGEIWATPSVIDSSRTTFRLQPVPPFSVKGKAAQVSVSSVGAPLSRAQSVANVALSGRFAELASLDTAFKRAAGGMGTVVQIAGGAGMGKTRLLAEAVDRADGMSVLRLAGEPFRTGSPYAVVRRLLRDLTDSADDGDPATGVRRWSAEQAPASLPWLPLLAAVFDVAWPDTPETADLAPQFRAQRLQELVFDLVTAALPAPSLLIVDDLHYADAASTEVLRHLAEHCIDRPWVMVLAERTEQPTPMAEEAVVLHLRPLDTGAARELLYADTDDAPLPPHVAAAVLERAAGNPFFLRQLARAARTVTGISELPDSVETVVTAQIDRLRPAAREVLRAGAVIGMSVDRELLQLLLDGERTAAEVDDAVGAVQEFVDAEGRRLRFRQAVARDAAYEGLPYRRRVALHGRLAALLDERAGDDRDGASVRALHHFHAGHHAAAFRLSRIGADQAADAHANVDAARLYRQALAAARHLSGTPASERGAILERLADVQVLLGEYDEADASYAAARRLLRSDPVWSARVVLKAERCSSQRSDHAQSLQRLRLVPRLVAGVSDLGSREVRLQARLRTAVTQFRQGRLSVAARNCRYVVTHADATATPDVLAEALGLLDVIEMSLGKQPDGSASRRALELYSRLDGRIGQARMHNQLGYTAYLNGRWDDAVANYRQSQQMYQRLGDLANAAINDVNVAEVLVDQGRLDEAEHSLTDALRVWRSVGAANDTAFALALLGRVRSRQGEYAESQRLLAQGRRLFMAEGAVAEVVDVDAYLAECLLLAGSYDAALGLAREAWGRACEVATDPAQGPLLQRVIGSCLDALGSPDEADAAFVTALAIARRRHADHEVAFTVAAMAGRARQRGAVVDPNLLKEAIPLQRRLGVVIDLDADASTVEVGVSAPGEDRSSR